MVRLKRHALSTTERVEVEENPSAIKNYPSLYYAGKKHVLGRKMDLSCRITSGMIERMSPYFLGKQPTDSPALVFIVHGFMGHPREFDPLVHILYDNGFAVHRVQLPAHGDRPGNLGRVTRADLMARCQADLNDCQQQYKTIHLLGFSLGGALSMVLAGQNRDVFASLTLVATPCKALFDWDYGQYHTRYMWDRFLPSVRYFLWQSNTGLPKPVLFPHDMWPFYQDMNRLFDDAAHATPFVDLPTLLLHSPYDITIPYTHSEWYYQRLPGETNFVTLLECGHQVFPFHVEGLVADTILSHMTTARQRIIA
jgi:pimeloyl-ACP methyl ester carboxylesterase